MHMHATGERIANTNTKGKRNAVAATNRKKVRSIPRPIDGKGLWPRKSLSLAQTQVRIEIRHKTRRSTLVQSC